jgi:hypothetical protein
MVASQVDPCVRFACMLAERLNAIAVLHGRCDGRQVIFLFSEMSYLRLRRGNGGGACWVASCKAQQFAYSAEAMCNTFRQGLIAGLAMLNRHGRGRPDMEITDRISSWQWP